MRADESAPQIGEAALIVAVSDTARWRERLGTTLDTRKIVFCNYTNIKEGLIAATGARVVLSPLIAHEFDCTDVALCLESLGFTGRYRAIACGLPRRDLIEQEIRELCPQIDFGIMKMREL